MASLWSAKFRRSGISGSGDNIGPRSMPKSMSRQVIGEENIRREKKKMVWIMLIPI